MSALREVDGVLRADFFVGVDGEVEGDVEAVHVLVGDECDQIFGCLGFDDLVELVFQGIGAIALELGFVGGGGEEVANLLLVGSGIGFGKRLDDVAEPNEGLFVEHLIDAPGALVGGDGVFLEPAAVDVLEEVLAGFDGVVEVGAFDPALERLFVSGRNVYADEQHSDSEDPPETFHKTALVRWLMVAASPLGRTDNDCPARCTRQRSGCRIKPMSWVVVYATMGWLIVAAMVPTILRRQFAPGAAMAWLGIVFLHPYIGWLLYMLVGETRLGPHRVERHRELVDHYRCSPVVQAEGHSAIVDVAPEYSPMVRQSEKIGSMPAMSGNCVDFIGESPELINKLAADIDGAKEHVHVLYYIFANDASGVRISSALKKAVERGVKCRVLADAVASRTFFHRAGLAHTLMQAGVEVAAALPVAPISRRLPRMDLRQPSEAGDHRRSDWVLREPEPDQCRLRRPARRPVGGPFGSTDGADREPAGNGVCGGLGV